MNGERKNSAEQERRQAIEQAYLMYFNRVLLNQGLITEAEHRCLSREISRRGSPEP